MRIYPNQDGSYDVVNNHKVLFHVTELKGAEVIGLVNDRWKHNSRALSAIPICVLKFTDLITGKKIARK